MKQSSITAIFALSILLALVFSTSVFAASGISIANFNFVEGGGCEYVAISVQVSGITAEDPPLNVQIFKNDSQIAAVNSNVYPSGTFSQGFVVDAVPGDQITATASLAGFSANAALACGESGGSGESSGGSAGGGATDGRLNYDAAEYYTLYCAFDYLEIWRGVPSGMLLHSVPLLNLLALEIADTYSYEGIAIVRSSDAWFTVYGSDGNTAPQAGSKLFSMTDCIARNGSLPAQPPPAVNPDPEGVDCEAALIDQTYIPECYESFGAFCDYTNYALETCESYRMFLPLLNLLSFFVASCAAIPAAGGMAFLMLPRWSRRLKRMKIDEPNHPMF